MKGRAFSRAEILFLVGAPLAWALLLLLHPGGEGTAIYSDIRDEVSAALVVHLGTLVFIPLVAAVIYLLLRGLDGTAARVSRMALVPWVIFYSAWEVLQGIANGILADQVNELPRAEQGRGAELLQDFAESPLAGNPGVLALIGTLAFVTATIAAAVALRTEANAPLPAVICLGLAGFLITAHPPPYGPTGLALLIVAVLLVVRRHSSRGLRAEPGQERPGPSAAAP